MSVQRSQWRRRGSAQTLLALFCVPVACCPRALGRPSARVALYIGPSPDKGASAKGGVREANRGTRNTRTLTFRELWGTSIRRAGAKKENERGASYYDQLSTDPEEGVGEFNKDRNGDSRGAINTPLRKISGFRMRKGGFYLDGTKDVRK